MNFIYKMTDVYKGRSREGRMGVAIGKLPHPYILPTKIIVKMRRVEFL